MRKYTLFAARRQTTRFEWNANHCPKSKVVRDPDRNASIASVADSSIANVSIRTTGSRQSRFPTKGLCTGIFPNAVLRYRNARWYKSGFRNIATFVRKRSIKGVSVFVPKNKRWYRSLLVPAPHRRAHAFLCRVRVPVNNCRARSDAAADETASPFVPIIIPVHTFSSAIS